jgi:hypothetical protein
MKTYRGEDITDLERIEAEMLVNEMRCFEADKVDKIAIINADVAGGSFVVWAATIVPSDRCPLPVFSSEIMQRVGDAKVRVDFHPLADLVRDMDYFEKYMMPLEPLWKKCQGLKGAGLERPAWTRALGSPFSTLVNFRYEDTVVDTALDVVVDYLKVYAKLWSETEEGDPAYMIPLNERKRAILDIFREKDPGRAPFEKALGEEKAHRLMNLLF